MKLGTKERYAVMALTDIAMNLCAKSSDNKELYDDTVSPCVSLSDIAARNNLPINYLEQIFVRLRRANLVKSNRGNVGGYVLSKPAEEISIKDIMDAIDKSVKTTGCVVGDLNDGEGSKAKVSCRGDHNASCINHHFWQRLENQINDHLGKVSIADLVKGTNKQYSPSDNLSKNENNNNNLNNNLQKAKPIYFDYNATSPLQELVKKELVESFDCFGNPSSVHYYGRRAKYMLESAREEIANFLKVQAPEIVFTGSGSEANNMILKQFPADAVAISATEHPSIMNIFNLDDNLNHAGANIIPVDKFGRVSPEVLDEVLTANDNIKLVSIIFAGNETGVINDIKALAKVCRDHNVLFHSDMVQALGKVDIDLYDLGVDFASFSGHKIGALKGIGAAFIRGETNIAPLIHGGGQEKRRRSGTENISGIISFASAIRAIKDKMKSNNEHVRKIRDFIESEIKSIARDAIVLDFTESENNSNALRLDNTLLLRMPGVNFDTQIINFDMAGIAVSAGSACSSGKTVASHVLRSMGYPYGNEVIRISLGPKNSMDEAKYFVKTWRDIYARLQKNLSDDEDKKKVA